MVQSAFCSAPRARAGREYAVTVTFTAPASIERDVPGVLISMEK